MDKDKITVELLCHHCKTPMEKRLKYLLNRVKKGKTLFFCSRRCADKHHSEAMKGENNPNYGGTFHGITSDKWTEEKRRKAAEKISKTMKEKGISKGVNNPRWRGGRRKVSCIICGKEYTVPPHIYDKIQAGDRKPCCSNDCARICALTQVKTERTSIEIKMAEELTRRGIEYIEQYNLGNKFALDFFLPEYNIVIECDGYYWHTLPEVAKRDKSKNAYIKACGYSLYRFWDFEINNDVEACVDIVMAEINDKQVV